MNPSRIVRAVFRRTRRIARGGLRRVRLFVPARRPKPEDSPATGRARADLYLLKMSNLIGRRRVVQSDGTVVVTVTTHGSRIETAYIALESIGRGKERPARFTLWLDDESLYRSLPRSIRRLQRRGLEVGFDPNSYRVHTKYYPYLKSVDVHTTPMVTADDDVIYPPFWLATLTSTHARFPNDVICFRAHRIGVNESGLAPYKTWVPCSDGHAGVANLGTSVSGQLFPPAFLNAVKAQGEAFRDRAPNADDLWLHACTVEENVATRQIERDSVIFPYVPASQVAGLYINNVWNGGNDAAIALTYGAEAIDAIRLDLTRTPGGARV